MNVVDSGAWLEYFANGPHASFFAKSIEQIETLIVPSLSVSRGSLQARAASSADENDALQAVAVMQQGAVVEPRCILWRLMRLDSVSSSKLPLADSVILATARRYDATLWTQDADFKGLEKVHYRKRRS